MKPLLLAILALFLLTACTSTDFTAFEDGGKARMGDGGSKEIVKGVDIWTNGTPPRAYRILGMINDTRKKAVIPMATFKGDMATAAKTHGGDAVIILSRQYNQLGTLITGGGTTGSYQGTIQRTNTGFTSSGTSSSRTAPMTAVSISDQVTTVAVIKYLE